MTRLAVVAWLMAVSQAAAYCGLEHCPAGFRPEQEAKWAVGLSWRMATFEQAGREIGFQQGTARLEWRPIRGLILGGDLPLSAPLTPSPYAYGFSNPLVFAEAALFPSQGAGNDAGGANGKGARFSIGVQCELPFGDVSEGFASGHVMAVPYAVAGRSFGAFSLSARLGWSAAVSHGASEAPAPSPYDDPLGAPVQSARIAHTAHTAHTEHGHADRATFIEPHSDRDLLVRIECGRTFRVGTAALDVNGAHALEKAFAPRNALSWGASFEVRFGEGLSIRPEARFPLSRPSRFESAGSVGIRKAF